MYALRSRDASVVVGPKRPPLSLCGGESASAVSAGSQDKVHLDDVLKGILLSLNVSLFYVDQLNFNKIPSSQSKHHASMAVGKFTSILKKRTMYLFHMYALYAALDKAIVCRSEKGTSGRHLFF